MLKNFTKVILSALLFLCLLQMPYGYYQFVRFACMVVFFYLAYIAIEEEIEDGVIIYVTLAVLFQPLVKISLGRTIWNVVDVIVGASLLASVIFETFRSAKKSRAAI